MHTITKPRIIPTPKNMRWIDRMNMANMVMRKLVELKQKVLKIEDAVELPCASIDHPCSGLSHNIKLCEYECILDAEIQYSASKITCLAYKT